MSKFHKNDDVVWNWSGGQAVGVVTDIYTERVEKTIKGSTIVRNATEDKPAYLIEQDNGNQVLKSETELKKA